MIVERDWCVGIVLCRIIGRDDIVVAIYDSMFKGDGAVGGFDSPTPMFLCCMGFLVEYKMRSSSLSSRGFICWAVNNDSWEIFTPVFYFFFLCIHHSWCESSLLPSSLKFQILPWFSSELYCHLFHSWILILAHDIDSTIGAIHSIFGFAWSVFTLWLNGQ